MAIYRRPKPRWPLAMFSALAGVGTGLVIAVLLNEDPDPRNAALEVKAELRAAAASLEVAAVEYEESVEDGAVVNQSEYRGARDALSSSRTRFEDARGALEVLAPADAESLEQGYDRAAELMEDLADSTEVESALDELSDQLMLGNG